MIQTAIFVCGILTGMVIAGILWESLFGSMIRAMNALLKAVNKAMCEKNAARKASKELKTLTDEFKKQTLKNGRRVSDSFSIGLLECAEWHEEHASGLLNKLEALRECMRQKGADTLQQDNMELVQKQLGETHLRFAKAIRGSLKHSNV